MSYQPKKAVVDPIIQRSTLNAAIRRLRARAVAVTDE